MKHFTIALLYNVRHTYPNPNDPQTQLEIDFDDPETTKLQIEYLKQCGYTVIPIEADKKAYVKLHNLRKKIDLALNLSEGIYGKDREAQIPAMLEMLQIPYTGSSPLTQALVLNKAKTKKLLMSHNISTLPFQVIIDEKEPIDSKLRFPLMVKPVSQGSSAGITNKSVVHTIQELRKQIRIIKTTFRDNVLIEPYLEGREFSVAMLGNPPTILPIIESDHRQLPKKYLPFDSLEVKWFYELETNHKNHLICPAVINSKLFRKIEKMCFDLWQALDIQDWCRIDIRCDTEENPYILEVNSPPGCTPEEHDPASYFPLASRAAGMKYQDLLKTLINTARKRYHL